MGARGHLRQVLGMRKVSARRRVREGGVSGALMVSGEANVFPELGRHGGSYHARGFAETESFVGSEELERVSFRRVDADGGALCWRGERVG